MSLVCKTLFLVVAMGVPALMSTRAEACSCRAGIFASSPSQGATNVPLNAELKLLGLALDASQVALTAGDAEVPVDVVLETDTYVRLRPASPLQPMTEYTLQGGEDGFTATFTTGTDDDEVAPENGTPGLVERRDDPPWEASSCSPTHGYVFTVSGASDDRTPASDLWYNVYVSFDGSEPGTTTPFTATNSGEVFFGQSACSSTESADQMRVRFAAVDYAGNEAAPSVDVPAQSCGCSGGGGALASALPFLVTGLAAFLRRKPRTS